MSDKRIQMRRARARTHTHKYIYIYVNVRKYAKWQDCKKTYVENNQEISDSCTVEAAYYDHFVSRAF
jgi:hypothetical protein